MLSLRVACRPRGGHIRPRTKRVHKVPKRAIAPAYPEWNSGENMRGYTNVAALRYTTKGGGGQPLQKLAFPYRPLMTSSRSPCVARAVGVVGTGWVTLGVIRGLSELICH